VPGQSSDPDRDNFLGGVFQPAELPESFWSGDTTFWWNDAVFYGIYVRSFHDSDADGIGDLQGIIEKLDYLNDGDPVTDRDLGVTALWLMPISQAASEDKFDPVNHKLVDPEYGTNEDFLRLIEEARARGMRVIVDLVMNHTGLQHPWFVNSRRDVLSPFRDYYVWETRLPNWSGPDGSPVWHTDDTGYYYAGFWAGAPELNFRNPSVAWELKEIIRFWIQDMRVDGFRVEEISYLIEDGPVQRHTDDTHDLLRRYQAYVKGLYAEVFTAGVVDAPARVGVTYVGDQVDVVFDIGIAKGIVASARSEDAGSAMGSMREAMAVFPPNQFATLLADHDEDRVMAALGNDRNRAGVAASLLLTGPGVPFLFYGEEIGMNGVEADRHVRSPMQWSSAANAGFSVAYEGWQRPHPSYRSINVEREDRDPNSLLSHYRRLIRTRNEHEALRHGRWTAVRASDLRIAAYLRHTRNERLLVVINTSRDPVDACSLSLTEGPLTQGVAREVFADAVVTSPTINASGGFDGYVPVSVVAPYRTYVIQFP
jgi:glycosidase